MAYNSSFRELRRDEGNEYRKSFRCLQWVTPPSHHEGMGSHTGCVLQTNPSNLTFIPFHFDIHSIHRSRRWAVYQLGINMDVGQTFAVLGRRLQIYDLLI